jgi:hypothetical protein
VSRGGRERCPVNRPGHPSHRRSFLRPGAAWPPAASPADGAEPRAAAGAEVSGSRRRASRPASRPGNPRGRRGCCRA